MRRKGPVKEINEYERSLNELAKEGEKHTNALIKRNAFETAERYGAAWNKTYFEFMDREAAARGIRYCSRYPRQMAA